MLSQVSKWGNSQGIRISKKILNSANIGINENVEIKVKGNSLIIIPEMKKTLSWYLNGYDGDADRYDWGASDTPKGRELL